MLQITPVGGPLVRYRSDDDIAVIADENVSSGNYGFAPGLGPALIPTGFDNSVTAVRINGRWRVTSARFLPSTFRTPV